MRVAVPLHHFRPVHDEGLPRWLPARARGQVHEPADSRATADGRTRPVQPARRQDHRRPLLLQGLRAEGVGSPLDEDLAHRRTHRGHSRGRRLHGPQFHEGIGDCRPAGRRIGPRLLQLMWAPRHAHGRRDELGSLVPLPLPWLEMGYRWRSGICAGRGCRFQERQSLRQAQAG